MKLSGKIVVNFGHVGTLTSAILFVVLFTKWMPEIAHAPIHLYKYLQLCTYCRVCRVYLVVELEVTSTLELDRRKPENWGSETSGEVKTRNLEASPCCKIVQL